MRLCQFKSALRVTVYKSALARFRIHGNQTLIVLPSQYMHTVRHSAIALVQQSLEDMEYDGYGAMTAPFRTAALRRLMT